MQNHTIYGLNPFLKADPALKRMLQSYNNHLFDEKVKGRWIILALAALDTIVLGLDWVLYICTG